MRGIRGGGPEHQFGIGCERDIARSVAMVRDRHAPQLRIPIARDSDIQRSPDRVFEAREFGAPIGEGRNVRTGAIATRLHTPTTLRRWRDRSTAHNFPIRRKWGLRASG